MARNVVRRMLGAGLLVAAIQGCGDSTGPDALAGAYRLERYEGAELPAVTFRTSGSTLSIVSQLIVLGDDGRGVIVTTTRAVDAESPGGRTDSSANAVNFTVSGSRVEITYVCPIDADCAPGPHLVGERSGDQLALAPPTSSKLASIYRRTT